MAESSRTRWRLQSQRLTPIVQSSRKKRLARQEARQVCIYMYLTAHEIVAEKEWNLRWLSYSCLLGWCKSLVAVDVAECFNTGCCRGYNVFQQWHCFDGNLPLWTLKLLPGWRRPSKPLLRAKDDKECKQEACCVRCVLAYLRVESWRELVQPAER